MAFEAAKIAAKVSLAGGALYWTIQQGIWGTTKDGADVGKRLSNAVAPAAKECAGKVPSLTDVHMTARDAWRAGVSSLFRSSGHMHETSKPINSDWDYAVPPDQNRKGGKTGTKKRGKSSSVDGTTAKKAVSENNLEGFKNDGSSKAISFRLSTADEGRAPALIIRPKSPSALKDHDSTATVQKPASLNTPDVLSKNGYGFVTASPPKPIHDGPGFENPPSPCQEKPRTVILSNSGPGKLISEPELPSPNLPVSVRARTKNRHLSPKQCSNDVLDIFSIEQDPVSQIIDVFDESECHLENQKPLHAQTPKVEPRKEDSTAKPADLVMSLPIIEPLLSPGKPESNDSSKISVPPADNPALLTPEAKLYQDSEQQTHLDIASLILPSSSMDDVMSPILLSNRNVSAGRSMENQMMVPTFLTPVNNSSATYALFHGLVRSVPLPAPSPSSRLASPSRLFPKLATSMISPPKPVVTNLRKSALQSSARTLTSYKRSASIIGQLSPHTPTFTKPLEMKRQKSEMIPRKKRYS